ncbi:unnamed protein product [Clonostachys rhizophaga]|uniref:Major facilitator superfamily (MFS) profile domain-containing protein n=1 Tax=Clonostachys rhizophaga TaxID=160324 RepID=A0A9N9YFE2_9HYPO|nr:unnamed protein product [Clonostachys rhizophaga]
MSLAGPSSTIDPAKPIQGHEKINEKSSSEAERGDTLEDIDPENEVQGIKLLLIHIAVCLCTFLVGLDFNLIATAVPSITKEFGSLRDVGWYRASFMVCKPALAGKTYTLFPKKLGYFAYIFIFEVGSLLCALAPSSQALIAGRAIAGLGASGIFAGGFTVLTTVIPLHKRAIWTGTMSSVFAISSIIGPVIAGALTQSATWRWCFWINLPIGGVGVAIVFIFLHVKPARTESAPLTEKLRSFDLLGFFLFAGSITMLLLALQWGGGVHAWSSSVIIGLFVGAGVVLLLFIGWQLYFQDKALIPSQLFKVNRNPALLCAASFFVNGPFQTVIYWLPIWFQGVLGVSPLQSGINFFPTVISDVLAAFLGSGIVMQVGWWNPFLLFAEAMVCLGGGLLSTIQPATSTGKWIGYQIPGGVGYSLASTLSHLAMQSSLPQDLVPLGSSTLLTIISTSCAVFMGIGQAVFEKRLKLNLESSVSKDIAQQIISAGATDVRSLIGPNDTNELPIIINQYSKSISEIWYIPAAAPAVSFLLIACCRWISLNSKKVKETAEGEKGSV